MSRPDWHYGDVLAHPMMDLKVMFICWTWPDTTSDEQAGYISAVALHDEGSSATLWKPGEIHEAIHWGHRTAVAKMVEEGPR